MTTRSRDIRSLGIALGLIALTLAVFGRVVAYPYTEVDDAAYVTAEPRVMDGLTADGVRWAWTGIHYGNWHPLTTLSYMAVVQFFGPGPGPQHAANLLLHVACTLLVFYLLRGLTGAPWRSAAVAALFAVHPLHVEPVVWIASRKDLLSGLFWLAALWAYAGYARRADAVRYGLALLLFALALMSKAAVLVLPVALLLVDWWPLRRFAPEDAAGGRGRRALALLEEKLPFLALSAMAAVVGVVTQLLHGGVRTAGEIAWAARVENAIVSYVRYLADTLVPWGLAPYYPHPRGAIPLWVTLGAAVLLAVLTGGALWYRRRAPYLAMGWAWFLALLAPVIGLVAVGAHARADRFMYLPLLGLLIAGVWGVGAVLTRFPRARGFAPAVGVAAVLAYAGAAFAQVGLWRDNEALFRHTLDVTGPNATAHAALANALLDRGRFEEAADHLDRAVALEPGRRDRAEAALANAFARQGRVGEGRDFFAGWPRERRARGLYHMANALVEAGRPTEAIPLYEQVLVLRPDSYDARTNLGVAWLHANRPEAAVEQFRAVLGAHPEDTATRLNLAAVLMQVGRADEARAEARQVLAREPDNPGARALLEALGEN